MTAPACAEQCRRVIVDIMARQGCEVHATWVPPLFPTGYEPLDMSCPHHPDPFLVLLGLLDKAVTRIAAVCLPWSNRSQHTAYLAGYRDGCRDASVRREMRLR